MLINGQNNQQIQLDQLKQSQNQILKEIENKDKYLDLQQYTNKIQNLDEQFLKNIDDLLPEKLISENLQDAIDFEFKKLQKYIQIAKQLKYFEKREIEIDQTQINQLSDKMSQDQFTQDDIDYSNKQQQIILEYSFQLALIMKEQFINPLEICFQVGKIHLQHQQQIKQDQEEDLDEFKDLFSQEILDEQNQEEKIIQSQFHQTFATMSTQTDLQQTRVNFCKSDNKEYYHFHGDDRYEGCPNLCPETKYIGNLKVQESPIVIKINKN